jgi:thioredoxin-related protein
MRHLVCLFIAWLLASSTALAAPADAFFDASLGDYAAELKTARQQGKRGVLLVFEAEGCPFCHRMRAQVLSRPEVQQYFRSHFSIFTVDVVGSVTVVDFAGREQTEKALARTLKVRGTPTFVFFAPDGREMARFSGVARDADEFLALGRFVAEDHWQRMTFEQFRSKP